MTFEQVAHLSETWGLVLLGSMFAAAVTYALWPSNREEFSKAAQAPLNDEDDNGQRS
jgi:cytochrome c oxidase cbb3-type subunit 4